MLRNFFIPFTDGIGHEKRKSDKIEVLDCYRIPGHFKDFFFKFAWLFIIYKYENYSNFMLEHKMKENKAFD